MPFISSFHILKDFSKDAAVQVLPLNKMEENRQKGKRIDLLIFLVTYP